MPLGSAVELVPMKILSTRVEDSRRVMPSVWIPLLATVIANGPSHCQLLYGDTETTVSDQLPSTPNRTELVLAFSA